MNRDARERVQDAFDSLLGSGVTVVRGDWGVTGNQLLAVRHSATGKELVIEAAIATTLSSEALAEWAATVSREADLIQPA